MRAEVEIGLPPETLPSAGLMEEAVVADALLMDVGYVILGISWEAVDAYEAVTGTVLAGRPPVPHDPSADPPPDKGSAADRYWDDVARRNGFDGGRELFLTLSQTVPDAMFDRAALALMEDARLTGHPVGILSNDAYGFMGREFFDGRPEFAQVDAFIDSTDVGARKPDPVTYLAAASALGVEPRRIVFLDDTPLCVEGARAVGMVGVDVDPFDTAPAFDQAREALGLRPRP